MCTALDVAKYVVNYQESKKGKSTFLTNNQRLQKLLYFIQAQSYKKNGKPIFQDDMEAWSLGPVIPEVFFHFPQYGELTHVQSYGITDDVPSKEERELVRTVVDGLEQYSTEQLKFICNNQSPWRNAYREGKINIIEKDAMKSFFE